MPMNKTKKLTIICGLSSTFKTTLTNRLKIDGAIALPEINRNYLQAIQDVVDERYLKDFRSTKHVDTLMSVSHRLDMYRQLFKLYFEHDHIVINRTIIEHLFFDNVTLLNASVDIERVIEAESNLLSQFDEVQVVIIDNLCDNLIKETVQADIIRNSIVDMENLLDSYHALRSNYHHFIKQNMMLIRPDCEITELEVPADFKVSDDNVADLIEEYNYKININGKSEA